MKTLFLMRHAKSSWDDPALADLDRPLNARGLEAAPFMGRLLKQNETIPEFIVSSTALRAFDTARLVATELDQLVDTNDRIYEASPRRLRGIVADLDDHLTSIMLVGHNPGMEGFLSLLTGEIQPMPTATVAIISLNIETWGQINDACGKLVSIMRPKEQMKHASQ